MGAINKKTTKSSKPCRAIDRKDLRVNNLDLDQKFDFSFENKIDIVNLINFHRLLAKDLEIFLWISNQAK